MSGSTLFALRRGLAAAALAAFAAAVPPPALGQCTAPGPPIGPVLFPTVNPPAPVTASDYLTYSWSAPAAGQPPDGYFYWINSDPPASTDGTTVNFAGPLGLRADVPVTLNVSAFACTPPAQGPVARSSPYSLAPPGPQFSASGLTVQVGDTVSFTDTSSPQATSWLWFFGSDGISTDENSDHVFQTIGAFPVVLLASNGSGSTLSAPVLINVTSSAVTPESAGRRVVRLAPPARTSWSFPGLRLAETNRFWLRISADEETVGYLRVERDGQLLVERRLVVPAGRPSRLDLAAYTGWDHERTVDVRLVCDNPVAAELDSRDPWRRSDDPLREP